MDTKKELIDHLEVVSSFKNQHDFIGKWGLKNLERFQHFLRVAVKSKEKMAPLNFDQCEFIDTEMGYKSADGKRYTVHADVLAKLGMKGSEKLVGVITEHTSHNKTVKDLYIQGLKYNLCLLEQDLPPIMTIFLLHGNAPRNIARDLQVAFGWTSEDKKLFGEHGLNYGPVVLDLRETLYEEIGLGPASAWFYTLKDVVNLTRERIEAIFKMCYDYSKDMASYRQSVFVLMGYIRRYTDFSLRHLSEFESKVIANKEDQAMQIMQSTYDQLINEGLQKGLQKGLQEGLQKGLQEGRQEGRQEGWQEGRQEGQQDKERSVILNMLKDNMDIDTIARYTGTSREQVLDIQKEAGL